MKRASRPGGRGPGGAGECLARIYPRQTSLLRDPRERATGKRATLTEQETSIEARIPVSPFSRWGGVSRSGAFRSYQRLQAANQFSPSSPAVDRVLL